MRACASRSSAARFISTPMRRIRSGRHCVRVEKVAYRTLVVNGNNDIMVPTINSFTLSQRIPNAQLILYPDSGHASQFQYPELFVSHAQIFLDA
jgi:pimeloyl-ACP methyl ester carboxylesterase